MNRTLSLEVLEDRQLLAGLSETPNIAEMPVEAATPVDDTTSSNSATSTWDVVGQVVVCAVFAASFIYVPPAFH